MTVLLFEYGALTHEKLTTLLGDVDVVCGAILHNHGLTFSGKSRFFQGSSVATVSPKKGLDVLGVVYKLHEKQMDLLDLIYESSMGLMARVKADVHDGSMARTVDMYVLQSPSPSSREPSPAYEEQHTALVKEAYHLYRNQVFNTTLPSPTPNSP